MKEGEGVSFHDPTDLFSALFGFPTQRGPQKGDDIVHEMKMSLEDLYQGKTKKLRITSKKVCPTCNGKGSPNPNAVQTCTACQGKGFVTLSQQIRPGLISTSRQPCRLCRQRGVIIAEKDKCPECHGDYLVSREKEIEVFVEKGTQAGQRITFPQEGDEEPGIEAGDLVVVIQEKPHPVFTRKGRDLLITKEISFAESLCGCSFEVETLDKRHLLIQTEEGDVIKPGDIRVVVGEGMPVYRSSLEKGNLVITFKVKYPEKNSLNETMKKNIRKIFPVPDRPAPPTDADVEEVVLTDPADAPADSPSGSAGPRGYPGGYQRPTHTSTSATGTDDDDDQYGGGFPGGIPPGAQQVQCTIQ